MDTQLKKLMLYRKYRDKNCFFDYNINFNIVHTCVFKMVLPLVLNIIHTLIL